MRSFVSRRWRNLGILLVLTTVVLSLYLILTIAIHPTSYRSGWVLIGLILWLTTYNLRKKLPFLPLGSSAAWLQLHIYTGLLSLVLFAVHIEFRLPNGMFEMTLTAFYLVVFFSGLGGLLLSRAIPARLTTRGDEVLFERIPVLMKQIRDEVEEVVLGCISSTDTTAIPEFYVARLKPFFDQPRYFWQHLLQSNRPRHALLEDIRAQDRFLNKSEQAHMARVADLACVKDDLDYQYALQWTLKTWLFVHVPVTYALVVLSFFHVVLVHAFAGGTR